MRKRKASKEAVRVLRETALHIQPPVAADRMWKRLLTAEDRRRLGGSLRKCYRRLGTAGIWMKVNGETAERAIIEIGCGLGFLSDADAKWLLTEFGVTKKRRPTPNVPSWNRAIGELRFENQLVRVLRLMNNPSIIQQIVEAFQKAGWPARLNNPLKGLTPHELHKAVQSLNRGLKTIRFRTQEGGKAVTWETR